MNNSTDDRLMIEAWLKAHDSLWLDKKFDEMRSRFRPDVVFVSPGLDTRTIGIDSALEGYRSFMETSNVGLYETHDYHFTRSGDTVIAEYAWGMRWTSEETDHLDRGREILALDVSNRVIKIFWRTQIATP